VHPAWSPEGEHVAFARRTGGRDEQEIVLALARLSTATGCYLEQLTAGAGDEYQFQGVGRDGHWLTYSWSRQSTAGEAQNGGVRRDLSTGREVALPDGFGNGGSLSPDGAFLVGAQPDGQESTAIRELEIATGDVREIAPHPAHDFLPSYSPDGAWIAFNSSRDEAGMDLYLFERGTGELTRLTSDPRYEAHAEFSPDGSRILFHRMMGERAGGGYDFDLFVLELDSGEETRLTDSSYEENYGSWAPDGRHLVFSSDVDEAPEHHNLYVLGPDGEIAEQLTDGDWKDSYAYWTRDGAWIYFNSERNGNSDLYRIAMDGVACRRVP